MNFVKQHEHELTSGRICGPLPRMGKHAIEKRQLKAIAARLVAGQEALGLNATSVCRLAGIKTNTYSQWVNAKGRPQLDEAMRLCEAFGYTLDWIYLGDPSGLPYSLASKLGLPGEPPPEALKRA